MKNLLRTGLFGLGLLSVAIGAVAQTKPAELKIAMTTFLSGPAAVFGVPGDRRVQQVIQVVPQIEEILPRSAAALSGGQEKMAALARADMVGTRLLMVDEPFQGLAPALARQYAESLSRLFTLRPELCVVITESNRALLDRIDCVTLTLERGEIAAADAARS